MKTSASDQPKKTYVLFFHWSYTSYIIRAGSWREESIGRVLKQAPAFITAGCASTAISLISLQIKHHFLHRQEAAGGNTVSIEEYHTNGTLEEEIDRKKDDDWSEVL